MSIRPIEDTDLEQVEQLIKSTILGVNAKDYSQPVVERMLSTDPFSPRNMKDKRDYFVFVDDGVRGIIGVLDNEVKTFFVDSQGRGRGVGTSLLAHAEKFIVERGYSVSQVYSNVSAKSYYEKQGYRNIREDVSLVGGETMMRYYMEKKLVKKD